MEAPEKIYLQEPTKVRTEKKYDNDVEYIRTDVLVAEIRKRLLPVIRDKHYDEWEEGQNSERVIILNIINALEVKVADLDKEIEEVKHNYKVDNNRHTSICSADIEWIAEHFFELGLKAQKV